MENKIICDVCKTENEEGYIYCKNCGAELKREPIKQSESAENTNPDTTYTAPQDTAQNSQAGAEQKVFYSNVACDIDGVTAKEMYYFVGNNSDKIVPKFTKMHLSKSNTSWCWPAAVLGFFFGPLGAAIWFFYRKMYKMALIAAAVGILLTSVVAAIGGTQVNLLNNSEQVTEALESGDTASLFEAFTESATGRSVLAQNLNRLINVATLVLAGLFSLKIYKDFTLQKIKEYRLRGIDSSFYNIGLSAVGGTSAGMAIVGIIIYVFSSGISAIITNLL